MSATRIPKVAAAVMLALFASASARAGPAPDDWSGIISLDWSTQLPESSPLRAEVDRIFIDAHIEWTMLVHFKKVSASEIGVKYTAQSATVDYLEVSKHDARGRRGDATIRTLQTDRLEASERVLDSRACNLVFWVNYAAKRYWIEVGGFKLEDVPRSGLVLIEVTDANGTRTTSQPTTGDRDVIKPLRFQGRYTERDPEILSGTFDANIDPPPGVELSYQTIGGMVEWNLFRGECPDVKEACVDRANQLLHECLLDPAFRKLDCDIEKIDSECLKLNLVSLIDRQPIPSPMLSNDCVKAACSVREGVSVTDADFEADINAMVDCWNEYSKTMVDCDRLCP